MTDGLAVTRRVFLVLESTTPEQAAGNITLRE